MRWLLVKDLRILSRSPLLVAMLVIYPIVIAALVGFAVTSGPDKPRVAVLNEVTASATQIDLGGESGFNVARKLHPGGRSAPLPSFPLISSRYRDEPSYANPAKLPSTSRESASVGCAGSRRSTRPIRDFPAIGEDMTVARVCHDEESVSHRGE